MRKADDKSVWPEVQKPLNEESSEESSEESYQLGGPLSIPAAPGKVAYGPTLMVQLGMNCR